MIPHYMIQMSYILPVISGLMHKQITVGVIVMIALTAIGMNQAVQSQLERGNNLVGGDIVEQQRDFGIPDKITGLRDLKVAAPIATSGDNIYIAWPTNTTGNDEVMFRASNDGGTTFAEKINLSNSM